MSDDSQRFLQLETDQYSVYTSKALGDFYEGEDLTVTVVRHSNLDQIETINWDIDNSANTTYLVDRYFAKDDIQFPENLIYGPQYLLDAKYFNFDELTYGSITFAAGQTEASFELSTVVDPVSGDYSLSLPITLTTANEDDLEVEFLLQDRQARQVELNPNQYTQFASGTESPIEINLNLEAGESYTLSLDQLRMSALSPFVYSLYSLDSFTIYNSAGEDVTPLIPFGVTAFNFTPETTDTYRIILMDETKMMYEFSVLEQSFTDSLEFVTFAQDSTQIDTPSTSAFSLSIEENNTGRTDLVVTSTRDTNSLEEGQQTIITLERSSHLDSKEAFVWRLDSASNVASYQSADWSDISSPLTGLLQFEVGQSTASFALNVEDDNALEYLTETLALSFTQTDSTEADLITSITIQDNDSYELSSTVDDTIEFVQQDQTVAIDIDLEAGNTYFSELTLVSGPHTANSSFSITDSEGQVIATNIAIFGTFAFTAEMSGRYTFTSNIDMSDGLYALYVYKDYQSDAEAYLNTQQLTVDDAHDFIMAALQQDAPELIYERSVEFQLSTELLSGIVGASVNDVNQFFLDHRYDPAVLG